VVESLDVPYQGQKNHQRISTTIVDTIEIQNRALISALWELLKSQRCTVLKGFKDRDNQTHALIVDLVKDLQAQQYRLIEEGVKNREQPVRSLVIDLVEGMWARQCHVIAIKRSIERYRAKKEDN
jgi:hypothetical protein